MGRLHLLPNCAVTGTHSAACLLQAGTQQDADLRRLLDLQTVQSTLSQGLPQQQQPQARTVRLTCHMRLLGTGVLHKRLMKRPISLTHAMQPLTPPGWFDGALVQAAEPPSAEADSQEWLRYLNLGPPQAPSGGAGVSGSGDAAQQELVEAYAEAYQEAFHEAYAAEAAGRAGACLCFRQQLRSAAISLKATLGGPSWGLRSTGCSSCRCVQLRFRVVLICSALLGAPSGKTSDHHTRGPEQQLMRPVQGTQQTVPARWLRSAADQILRHTASSESTCPVHPASVTGTC